MRHPEGASGKRGYTLRMLGHKGGVIHAPLGEITPPLERFESAAQLPLSTPSTEEIFEKYS